MWFRRRRKADSDNALTETLRSLQPLLDEGPSKQREEDSLPPVPSEKPDPHVAEPSPGSTAHSVVSEEHLTWDFDVDMSSEEPAGRPVDTPKDESLEPLDDDADTLVLETSEFRSGESLSAVDSRMEDTTRDKPGATFTDTIPVLNNVVFMPAGAHATAHADRTPLMDLCIEDFRNRLVQHAQPALDPPREQRLRAFLTSLLDRNS